MKNSAFASVRSGLLIREASAAKIDHSSHASCSGYIPPAASEIAALADIESVARELDAAVERATDGELVQLLELAKVHFKTRAVENCPICEQPVEAQVTLRSLTERLATLTQVKTLSSSKKSAAQSWQRVFRRTSDISMRAKQTFGIEPGLEAPLGALLLTTEVAVDEFGAKVLAVGCESLRKWMSDALQAINLQLTAEIEKVAQVENRGEFLLFLQAVQEAVRQRSSTNLIDFLERDVEQQASSLETIADAIRKARQDVAQKMLNEIATTVTAYYRKIHPDESECEVTGAPTIDIHRTGGGIAYLRGTFNNKSVEDPRWVYSDGHLDTVGLCVFLALRRFRANQKSDAKLMVLDDVVLSIDLGHARRLLMVLKEDFDDHQIFIFTHNRLFATWADALLPSFKKKTITGWSLDGGVQLGDFRSSSEALRERISASASPKDIAQAMMTLMDELMLDARFAYQLSVPARRGEQYTLSELWEPFTKRVKELEKTLKAPLGKTSRLLGQLSDLPRVRNVLAAHDNEFAREFPLATIRELSQSCLDLMNELYCGACCSFVEPVPDRTRPVVVCCRCRRLSYLNAALTPVQPVPSS